MIRNRLDAIILCKLCTRIYGKVVASEDSNRMGFWSNSSTPDVIPKKCPTCQVQLERVSQSDNYI